MNDLKAASSNETCVVLQDTNIVLNNPAQRTEMILMSAYFRAEKRDFSPSNDLADWFESELEIDRHLSSFSS